MTREILFRGFNENPNGNEEIELDGKIIKGKWVEGFYWNNGVNNHFIKQLYSDDEYQKITLLSYEVIPETVSQYTGLDDTNGKKIFDKDLLRYKHPTANEHIDEVFFDSNYGTFEIAIDRDRTKSEVLGFWLSNLFEDTTYEVIGTIFDKKGVSDDTITFYTIYGGNQYHCVIHCSSKTFSTDLENRTSRRIFHGGFSCYELKNFSELKDLVRCLRYKKFTEIDYFEDK